MRGKRIICALTWISEFESESLLCLDLTLMLASEGVCSSSPRIADLRFLFRAGVCEWIINKDIQNYCHHTSMYVNMCLWQTATRKSWPDLLYLLPPVLGHNAQNLFPLGKSKHKLFFLEKKLRHTPLISSRFIESYIFLKYVQCQLFIPSPLMMSLGTSTLH